MLEAAKTIEIETNNNPQFSVIWLHGLGAGADDFVPIIAELGLASDLAVRFIFPNAPQIAVTINGGYVMPAWYDIIEMHSHSRKVDQAGIAQSVQQINQLIEQEKQRGIAAQHIFIAGFSQGGAIAYYTALTQTTRLAGVIALSTYIPEPAELKRQMDVQNVGLPIYVGHGAYDPVVDKALGEQAFAWLQEVDCSAQWFEYPMAHQVCREEIQDIGCWLTLQMKGLKSAIR